MAQNRDFRANYGPNKKPRMEVPETTPLHDAIRDGNVRAMMEVLKLVKDVNLKIRGGFTPLHIAVREGQLDCFNLLLHRSPDVSITDARGRLPLHYAAQNGEVIMLRRLAMFHVTLDGQDERRQTPLHIALEYKMIDCAEELLNAGANVDIQDYYNRTPLHIAIRHGCDSIVEILLALNANINLRELNGFTPLHVAVRVGNMNYVEKLLNRGSDVQLKNSNKPSPLHVAAERDNRCIWKKLLDRTPTTLMDEQEQFKLLEAVLLGNRPDYFDDLLEVGIDVQLNDKPKNSTLLHLAAQCRSELPLKKLLELNLDIDAQDYEGSTPLHLACENLRFKNILLLLDAGARWDITDNSKLTMLCDLLESVMSNDLSDAQISLLRAILERTNDGLPIDNSTKESAAHLLLNFQFHEISEFNFDLTMLVVSTQKRLDVMDKHGHSVVYYITHNLSRIGMDAAPLIRICVERGAHLNWRDCNEIKNYPNIRDNLLQDVQFCLQSIANEFNSHTLVKLYKYLNNAWIAPIEALRINPNRGSWQIIEHNVRSEIKSKGYCDVSRLVTTSLSKQCVVCLQKYFNKVIIL